MQEIANTSNDINIQRNASLQPYNTLAVPAKAEFLSRCNSLSQIIASLDFAKRRALPIVILGEGSNTVFSKDFDGLVILNRLAGINLISEDSQNAVVEVAAGENWHDFVRYSLEQGWYGLENLALIPGLVGAAPIQNIGAYGVEVKDSINRVDCLEIDSQQPKVLSNSECNFGYRDSAFKQTLTGKYIVTSVTFSLSKSPTLTLSYPALADRFEHLAKPMDVFEAVSEIRAAKLPMPDDIPNAGSFFKNPIVDSDKYKKLKASFPPSSFEAGFGNSTRYSVGLWHSIRDRAQNLLV